MGAFDDLIPAGTEQAAPQRAGMFDDLIPQQQRPPQEEKGFIGRMEDKAMDVLSPYLSKLPDIVSPEEESQLRSFAMGAADPSVGAAQLLANTEIANLLTGGRAAPAVNEGIRRKEAEALAQREAAGREGFDAYRMGGAVASPPFMAAMRAPVAAGTLGRILQGGAMGAGAGAVSPVTNEDFLATKAAQVGGGTALGAAIPGGIELAKYGGSRLRNLIDPWLPGGIERAVGRTSVAAAGKDAPMIQRELEAAGQPFVGPQMPGEARRVMGEIIPGSMPTAGEIAARTGNAEFAGLQKITEGRLPTAYTSREIGNEAARIGAIRGIGKDEIALKSAIDLRRVSAAENYGKAGKETIKADFILDKLMRRPSMSKVISRAKDLAEEQDKVLKIGKDIPEQIVHGKIVGESGAPLATLKIPAEHAKYPVESLHYMKMAMDDLISNPERFGIGAAEANAINKTRGEFLKWVVGKSSAYEKARATYAGQSVPINRMEVGQELEKSLTSPMGTSERPTSFASAVRNAPQTIKRATGQPRYDELGEVLDPRQTQAVGNVLEDLQRTSDYERLAKAGSERARELVGQIEPKVPAAGMFNPKYSVFRAISNRLAGKVEGKSLDALSDAMLDPAKMARLMKNAAPKDRKLIVNELMANGEHALAVQAIMGISREQ